MPHAPQKTAENNLRRISLMIREDQYAQINREHLNLSALVRNMLDDHFSGSKVTLHLSDATRQLYSKVISGTGASDEELEPYLRKAFQAFLQDRIKEMQKLEQEVASPRGRGGQGR